MKVNVLSRKLVKPFNPTPSHLRTYKISLLDEINPSIYHPRLLYFSSDDRIEAALLSLEESLAQILSKFYPLAGRYDKEKREVCCNDEGAQYSVAEVDCDLSQIVGATTVEPEHLNQLLPVDITVVDDPADPILAVQINRFRCGGLAIGVCMSHRVGDTAAFALFLTAWAEAAATGGKHFIEPHFDHRPSFPTENLPPLDCHDSRTKPEKIACRRYVFDGEAIQKLREQLITEWKSIGAERPPSRVVAVSTFLTQAVLRADKARHGRPRATVVGQLIEIRERTVPPVSKNSFGTWLSGSFLELAASEAAALAAEKSFPRLASKIHQITAQGVRDCARLLSDGEFGRKLLVDNFFEALEKGESYDWKVIWVTDISKFGEYDADFGFGKPVWVSFAAMPMQDHIILLNNKNNDGIEAWVFLQESDMQLFPQGFPINTTSKI